MKYSVEDCYKIKLWTNMSDSQFDDLREALSHFGKNDLFYCSDHIRKSFSKGYEEKVAASVECKNLKNGGCIASIKKAIVFISSVLEVNIFEHNSSTWKLMIDGRPKGKNLLNYLLLASYILFREAKI